MDLLQSLIQSPGNSRQLPKPSENLGYISMFRIDGVPIIPPLMTSDKRRQMRRLKEEAIQLERKLAEKRRNQCNMALVEQVFISDAEQNYPQTASEECISIRSSSTHFSADALAERDSYYLLSSIMNSVPDCKQTTNSSTCTLSVDICESEIREQIMEKRMQKLKKSETLIYDNRSNTITINKPVAEKCPLKIYSQQQESQNTTTRRSSLPQIPAICVNPPTPTTETRSDFCKVMSISESVGNLQQRDSSVLLFNDDSTDESGHINFNASRVLKSHNKVADITAKITQFERRDENSGGNQVFDAPYIPIRSATSPSLKRIQTKSPCIVINNHNNGTGDHSDTSLIRSNSFTLDAPSKALLDHIRQANNTVEKTISGEQKPDVAKRSCHPSASATRDTVESRAKRVQKVELKPRSQMMRGIGKNSQYCAYTANVGKAPRSPYDLKSSARTKVIRPLKAASTKSSPIAGSVTMRSIKSKSLLATPQSSSNIIARSSSKGIRSEILTEIEAEHRQKFMQLVAQQHEEQKRLHQTFEAQQKLLLEELSSGINKIQMKSSTPTSSLPPRLRPPPLEINTHIISFPTSSLECSPTPISEKSEIPSNSSPTCSLNSTVHSYSMVSGTLCDVTSVAEDPASLTNRTGKYCTPRRRLFSGEDSSEICVVGTLTPSSGSTSVSRRSHQRQQHLANQRRAEAATLICAYARGFLTRRLFQTEQIQRIVQTIRDTLVFVLNLHSELNGNPEEANSAANIKLKARLLQQLSSASRTLHLVFFQTSVKDRMDIIARDRKRIRAKLLNVNTTRSPRIST